MGCCNEAKAAELRAAAAARAASAPAAAPVKVAARAMAAAPAGPAEPETAWRAAICEVCRLLDGDERTPRPSRYCAACEAWICKECWGNLIRRARAMLKRAGLKRAAALAAKRAQK